LLAEDDQDRHERSCFLAVRADGAGSVGFIIPSFDSVGRRLRGRPVESA
jgi:hypothetical protein